VTESPRFIVDHNVGKLAKWLRMMGYDTLFFSGDNDSRMVALAQKEDRVILTKDTQIMRRHLVTSGQIKALLIKGDKPEVQVHQVITTLNLDPQFRPFSICLECNQPLLARSKPQVKDLVPPYVFKTQSQYMECPTCHRIYWRGTHWQAMTEKLRRFREDSTEG
jgi:uncharacterized protein with PIN domain